MHKFVSFLFALLLLTFSVLPVAAQDDKPPSGTPNKDFYFARLTDHNPPNMVTYFTPKSRQVKIVVLFRTPPAGYKAGQVTLEFYDFKDFTPAVPPTPPSPGHPATPGSPAIPGMATQATPDNYFDPINPFQQVHNSLKQAPITKHYYNFKTQTVQAKTEAIYVFTLKQSIPLPLHLLLEESYTFVPTSSSNPKVITKGPVFATLLLEPHP